MKANKKLLSLALTASIALTSVGCSKTNKEDDTKTHRHYYLNYGGTSIIIRECDDNPVKIKNYITTAGCCKAWVIDSYGNNIIICHQSSYAEIRNEQEEEYANRLENMLIESGNAILFDPKDFGIEKPNSLSLEK